MKLLKVAVTGTTGLIGGNIYKNFSKKYKVISIGRRDVSDLKADFSKPETLENLNLNGINTLIHCAGVVNEDFRDNPGTPFIQSTKGLSYLVKRSYENNVNNFIYFSAAQVYGELKGKIDENTPANPLNEYALAHYAAEQILKSFSKTYKNINFIILRPSAVYGLPVNIKTFDRWSLIPFSFPLAAIYNKKIVLKTSGKQKRNFVSVKDIAVYVERIINNIDKLDDFTIVNPVGVETISVYDFACKCAEMYKEIQKISCEIIKPNTKNKSVIGEDFSYESIFNFYKPTETIDDFLREFFNIVIEKMKKGIKIDMEK